jgi:hypothetical protein
MRVQPSKYYDPEEDQRRWELEHMARFAGEPAFEPDMEFSVDEAEGNQNPIHSALARTDDQPEPDAERAYQNLQGPDRGSPRPQDLEMDAMRAVRDSYANDKGNFFEDNTVPIVAGGLDLLFNKGRGLGAIVAGGGMAAATRDANRKSNMRQLAQMQLSMNDADVKREHEQRMFGLQEGNLAARQAELDEMRARRMGKTDTDLQKAQTNLTEAQAYQLWNKDPSALSPEQQAMNEDRDAARTDRERQFQLQLQDRQDARADSAATRAEVAAARKQQQEIMNADRAEKADTSATNKFLDKTGETRSQAAGLKRAEPIIEDPKYSKDLPGVGMVDSRFPAWVMHPFDKQAREDQYSIEKLAGEAGQYFKHAITGAASSIPEQRLLLGLKGLEPGATEEEFRTSIQIWKEGLQGDLRARASASPENARKALDAQGLGDWALGPEAAAAPPASGDTFRAGNGRRQAAGAEPMSGGTVNSDPYLQGTPDQLRTQPRSQVPKVTDYLRRLQDQDDDLGVTYR